MIKALIDLNVLLDFLKMRESYAEAAHILGLAAERKFKAYASAHEMTTLAYFLEKEEHKAGGFRKTLSTLLDTLQVLPVDEEALRQAMHSGIEDFEDAVLEAVSLKAELGAIVTRNMKDFSRSRVKAVNPAQFIAMLRETERSTTVRERKPSYTISKKTPRVRKSKGPVKDPVL